MTDNPLTDTFSQDTTGLSHANAPAELALSDSAVLDLRIGPVAKKIGDATLRMLAYNASIPGPVLRVRQHSRIHVHVTNDADLEQTVHWHGLRLENRYDGVPHETQEPIPVGGRFSYELQFPDSGVYWYHPHIREDYGQEMGLSGMILVEPAEPDYWSPVNRELALTLDDILLQDGRMPAFYRSGPTHTMMGRFGTVMLVDGETQPTYDVSHGEVIRLYLVNTANTRILNVAIREARMKLVGGDSGRCEHDEFVDSVMLSPSERAVVEVLFDQPGDTFLEHHPPGSSAPLATFHVGDQAAVPSLAAQFEKLRTHNELVVERKGLLPWRDRAADKTLLFVGEMDMSGMGHDMGHDMGGMQHDMTHEMSPHGGARTDDGIEWEDTMPEMNVMSDRSNMHWKLIDTDTGAVNHEIFWTFRVGDRVKLRLDNTAGSDHEMHHPFHIHGAGRFLVLDRGGVEEANLVWKDTVLVRAGEVVNILFDASNPGRWMAHCHIAEHTESGMMFSFDVVSGVAP